MLQPVGRDTPSASQLLAASRALERATEAALGVPIASWSCSGLEAEFTFNRTVASREGVAGGAFARALDEALAAEGLRLRTARVALPGTRPWRARAAGDRHVGVAFGVLAGTSLGVAGAVFLLAPRGLRSRLGRGRTTVKRQRGGFVKLKI